ncbi:MAG: FlgD immunoglobulin-like domain containing protein [Candidatus Eisenbacteria bacterium]
MLHFGRRTFLLPAAALALVLGCALLPAPARASNVILEWTAPGDDSTYGHAMEYDLRWSLRENQFPNRFYSARRIVTNAPQSPGSVERAIVSDVPEGAAIYFALRTRDERGNWSRLSNVAVTYAVTEVGDNGLTLEFSQPSDNPAHDYTQFTLSLPKRGNAVVDAMDVSGRRIRRLRSGTIDAGRHTIAWDLRDDSGRATAPGVYFVRAQVDGLNFVRRVVVLQ